MQYSDDNVSDILFWAYDEATNKYICKNENGKVVNSVTKYHLKMKPHQVKLQVLLLILQQIVVKQVR